jgi:hypothetical protein
MTRMRRNSILISFSFGVWFSLEGRLKLSGGVAWSIARHSAGAQDMDGLIFGVVKQFQVGTTHITTSRNLASFVFFRVLTDLLLARINPVSLKLEYLTACAFLFAPTFRSASDIFLHY